MVWTVWCVGSSVLLLFLFSTIQKTHQSECLTLTVSSHQWCVILYWLTICDAPMHHIVQARHLTLCDACSPPRPDTVSCCPPVSSLPTLWHLSVLSSSSLSLLPLLLQSRFLSQLSCSPVFSPLISRITAASKYTLHNKRVLNNGLRVSVCVTWSNRRVCMCVCDVERDLTVMSEVGGVIWSFLKNDWPIIWPGHVGMYKKATIPILMIISLPQSINTPPWLLSSLWVSVCCCVMLFSHRTTRSSVSALSRSKCCDQVLYPSCSVMHHLNCVSKWQLKAVRQHSS